jgi:hypothetical protein
MSDSVNDPNDASRLHFSAREAVSQAIDELGLAGSSSPAVSGSTDRPRRGDGLAVGTQVGMFTLVDLGDGALAWRDGVRPSGPAGTSDDRRPRRASYDEPVPIGEIVQRVPIEILEPNQVVAKLMACDTKLNANPGLREWKDGQLVPLSAVPVEADGTFGVDEQGRPKRALLVVHGTFSSTDAIFDQLKTVEQDTQFLAWAARSYDIVLAFDHPTLAISPVLNGMDLARLFANVKAPVDVVCHSRGGLVVRWWLEAFAGMKVGPRRVVFVAAPLGGTSLASPPRLRNALDMFTTISAHLKDAGEVASVFLPFMSVTVVLLTAFGAVTGTLAKTPLADAAFAMVPGLGGMSRVGNSPELDRLQDDRPTLPQYFAISSDFSMEKIGWKFWRFFYDPVKRVEDALAGIVFDGPNDLVVDTASMTYMTKGMGLKPDRIRAFTADAAGNNPVFHTNYFLQKKTAEYITDFFKVP